ncbi:MAG: TIM barrel protein [Candidatus Margulisiibacteriota bacterium]
MYRFGLKLWSTNANYRQEAERLLRAGVCQYVELYTVPASYEEYGTLWAGLKVPYVIHAPHFRGGMNLAKKEQAAKNLTLIREAQQFADRLMADKIIVHPGIAGEIKETTRQLALIKDRRILIENKPYHALDDDLICNGTTPAEIKLVMDGAGVGFCLDIGHAICAANAQRQEPLAFLREFLRLKPAMFHLTDGDRHGVLDSHSHIGQGNFDFPALLRLLPADALVTVETDKSSPGDLRDYEQDIARLKEYDNN